MKDRESYEACSDALMELSERGELTAESAFEILARCPDCADELRRLILGFALASELSREEPKTDADNRILTLAGARDSRMRPITAQRRQGRISILRVPRTTGIPIATAAATLLMIAIGASLLAPPLRVDQQRMARPSRPAAVIENVHKKIRAMPLESPSHSSSHAQQGAVSQNAPEPNMQSGVVQRSPHIRQTPKAKAPEDGLGGVKRDETQDVLPRLHRQPTKATPAWGGGLSSGTLNACKARVDVFEALLERQESFTPSPTEELEVGICYKRLGERAAARELLTRASTHPETKARAIDALRELD